MGVGVLRLGRVAAEPQRIGEIARRVGRSFPSGPAEEFVRLGEQYYREEGALRADPRDESANVWYWRDNFLTPTSVPTAIFGAVMAMRSAEEALKLEPLNPQHHFVLACVLEAEGHGARAADCANEALRINPRHTEARKLLDRLSQKLKTGGTFPSVGRAGSISDGGSHRRPKKRSAGAREA